LSLLDPIRLRHTCQRLSPYIRTTRKYDTTRLVLTILQGLGAAKNAVRMARIAKFYEKLPKGPAPQRAPSGLLGRYQARYFGKNPSAARTSIFHAEKSQGLIDDSYLACDFRYYGNGIQHGVLFPFEYVQFDEKASFLTNLGAGHHKNNAH
jgi:hypothetical protein